MLPFLAAGMGSLWTLLRRMSGQDLGFGPALAGVGAYAATQIIFQKPMRIYVFGHEMTHALAAWFSGFRVRSMSVSAKGGEVILSGTNAAVALAPYCVPIYTLFSVAALFLVDKYSPYRVPAPWFAAAVGFTFAFHVALTVYALGQSQPDLRCVGPFLSMVVILSANVAVFVLVLKLLFPTGVSLRAVGSSFVVNSLIVLDEIAKAVSLLASKGWSLAAGRLGHLGRSV